MHSLVQLASTSPSQPVPKRLRSCTRRKARARSASTSSSGVIVRYDGSATVRSKATTPSSTEARALVASGLKRPPSSRMRAAKRVGSQRNGWPFLKPSARATVAGFVLT